MNYRIISILTLIIASIAFFSCKKLVQVDGPPTSLSSKSVYNNDLTSIGAVTSLYVNLSNGSPGNPQELTGLSAIAGLSADEFDYYAGAQNQTLNVYYQNALNSLNIYKGFWETTYQRLYVVNEALEGLGASTGLTPAVKQHLLGEAYFMRAFYYFYLVNLYGDVPLVLNTDYTVNALIRRSSKVLVYNQIVADLKAAQNLLSEGYLKSDGITTYPTGSEERVRPNQSTATALLARTYLFLKDFVNADIQASLVLANAVQFQLEPLDKVFLKNNREAIWQLQPIGNGYNTQEARVFIIPDEGPSGGNPIYLSSELMKDFQPGDQRRNNWTASVNANGTLYYYPYKYKIKAYATSITEYSTVIRLAELYLIRAESRASQNKLDDAISDIDKIRGRAGLGLIHDTNPNISQKDLLNIILKEKRIEFFTEWGHRWFDLKRTGEVDDVMSKVTPKKSNGSVWKDYQQYYPVGSYELQSNPNLIQTVGY